MKNGRNEMGEKLLAYYFGVIDGQDRHDVEEKLLSSPAMLMDFIALKRSFEVDDQEVRVPSPAAAARLRGNVEAKFGKASFSKTSFDKASLEATTSNVFGIRVGRAGRWVPAAIAAMLLVLAGGYSLYTKAQKAAKNSKPVANRVSGDVDSSGDAAVSLSLL